MSFYRFMVLFLILVSVSACGSTPYFKVGLGYQLDKESDWYVQTQRSWQCHDNLQGHFELGLEWDNDVTLGVNHQSWVFCGGPFNTRPEIYQNDIRLSKKWGGR